MHHHRHQGEDEHQAKRHRQQIKWVVPLPVQINIERHMRTKESSGDVVLGRHAWPWPGRPFSAWTTEPLALPGKSVTTRCADLSIQHGSHVQNSFTTSIDAHSRAGIIAPTGVGIDSDGWHKLLKSWNAQATRASDLLM